jgi:hypothetical protein
MVGILMVQESQYVGFGLLARAVRVRSRVQLRANTIQMPGYNFVLLNVTDFLFVLLNTLNQRLANCLVGHNGRFSCTARQKAPHKEEYKNLAQDNTRDKEKFSSVPYIGCACGGCRWGCRWYVCGR